MNLYELLSIFPFGEEIQIMLQDRRYRTIRESMICRPVYLDEDVNIPTGIMKYLNFKVLEFHPEGNKIAIVIDIDIKEHNNYVHKISLTVI